jgi:hypothetical protein
MSNCTGVIFGKAIDTNGQPLAGIEISLNWIFKEGGGPLTVGGDDDLRTFVPKCLTTKAGEYLIPFFWKSTEFPGSTASALAMKWNSGGTYQSQNKHGQAIEAVDLRKLIGVVAPPLPGSAKDAAGAFLDFYQTATPELKGMGIVTRFISSFGLLTAELRGCYSNIYFVF